MLKPQEVKARARRLEDQNYKFRTFLKNCADYDKLDAQFLALHRELFANHNCCECANCCKTYGTTLEDEDIERISAHLNMTAPDFIAEYLVDTDSYGEKGYQIKESPCTFLEADGRCRIQACKPRACEEFPFTDKPGRLMSMLSIIDHAEVCPVVFEILERLKVIYKFRNRG